MDKRMTEIVQRVNARFRANPDGSMGDQTFTGLDALAWNEWEEIRARLCNVESFATAVDELRDEHRIKRNVDFAVLHKYGKTQVMCHAIWYPTIKDVFNRHGISIAKFHFAE